MKREAIDRSDSYAYDNKIATAQTSNDLPDIFYVDGPQVSYYAANGLTVPLDDYFTEEDQKDFVDSAITQNTYDSHLYAIGATESSVAFYYNKDYLKECGVDVEDLDSRTIDNPITWSELAEIAEKCTTEDYVGTHIIMDHGEGLPYALEPMYLSAGKDYISEDGTEADGYVNSEEAVKTISFLADLIAKGYATVEPIKDEFLNGDNVASYAAAIAKPATRISAYDTEEMAEYKEGVRAVFKEQLENTAVPRPRTPSYATFSSAYAEAMTNIFSDASSNEEVDEDYIQSELDTAAETFTDDYETYYAE